jgi:predicted nucleic-acid-binding Zn-ribbon protein
MISKCNACGGMSFELKEVSPYGSAFKMNFIQCQMCGTPFGVTDYYNSHTAIEKTQAQIKKLEAQVSQMGHTLNQIAHALNNRR